MSEKSNHCARGVVAKWSRDKFGRVFDFLPNNTFSRAFMEYSHDGIRNVHYGDVLIKFGAVLDCSKEVLPSLCPEVEKRVGSNFAQDGDLIVADTAEDDTVGKAVELQNVGETKIVSGLHTIFSRPRNKVFAPYWLGYFVNSDFFHRKLFRYIVGSKVSSIAKASLKNVDVLWPELEEQRKTVEILVACDEVIEKSERAKEKLRRVKDGLLADLMTRGIGNDGKIRPRPAKAPHLYKQSELGLIPKEWDVKRLVNVCSIQLGKMLDAVKNVGVEKPYLGNKAVQWGRIDLAAVEKVRLTDTDMAKFRLRRGDLLVCRIRI